MATILRPLLTSFKSDARSSEIPLSRAFAADPQTASTPLHNRWQKIEPWAFGVGIFLLLVPLWGVRHFPSQDGPLHLYNAVAFRDYNRPDRPLFREFFQQNTALVPNWVCPHLLPVLVRWMSPQLAEKLVLSAYLLLFPLSIRYCLMGVRKHAGGLAIAALPFVPNQFYHMGFQDYCLSLAGFFITLGYFLRRRKDFGFKNSVVLAVLLLATYVTHILSAVMVLPLIGLIALFTSLSDRSSPRKPWLAVAKDLLPTVLAMVPVTAITLYFVLQPHPTSEPFQYPKGWAHRFYFLAAWMKGLGLLDLLPDIAVLLLFVGTSLILARVLRRDGAWRAAVSGLAGALLFTGLAYFFLFLIAPDFVGGGSLVLIRLAAYPLFAALLWWAALPLSPSMFRRLQITLAAVSLPALLAMLTLDMVNYVQINRYLDDFEAIAPRVAPNSTLLPIHFDDNAVLRVNEPDHRLTVGVDPFRHAASVGLAARGVVNLANEWASTDHQSLRWQKAVDPMFEGMHETQDFDAYTRRTGISIDYVVLWTGGLPHNDLEGRAIKSQLSEYQLIYRSPHDGYLELYRKIKSDPPAALAAGN